MKRTDSLSSDDSSSWGGSSDSSYSDEPLSTKRKLEKSRRSYSSQSSLSDGDRSEEEEDDKEYFEGDIEEELGLTIANAQLQDMMAALLERSKAITNESIQQDEKAVASLAHFQPFQTETGQLLVTDKDGDDVHVKSNSKYGSMKRARDLKNQRYLESCMEKMIDLLQHKREQERVHVASVLQEVQEKYEDALGGIVTCFNRHTQWLRDSYVGKMQIQRQQVQKQREDDARLHEALMKEALAKVQKEYVESHAKQQLENRKREEELRAECNRITTQNTSLVNVQKKLRKELERQKQAVDEYRMALGKQEEQVKSADPPKTSKERLRTQNAQLQSQIHHLQEKYSALQEKVSSQQKTIRGLEKTIAKLEDAIADLQDELVELGKMLTAVREHLGEVQAELAKVTEERNSLASTCESLRAKCNRLDELKKEQAVKISDLNTTIKRKTVEHDKRVQQLEGVIKKLENENQTVQVKFEESEEKLQLSHKQIGELQMSILKALNAQENAQKTIAEVQKAAEIELKRKDEEVERLGMLGESAKLQLEKKVSALEVELSKAKTGLEQKDHENLRMQATITKLNKVIADHNKQQKMKEKKLGEENKKQIATLKQTIATLEKQQAELLKQLQLQQQQMETYLGKQQDGGSVPPHDETKNNQLTPSQGTEAASLLGREDVMDALSRELQMASKAIANVEDGTEDSVTVFLPSASLTTTHDDNHNEIRDSSRSPTASVRSKEVQKEQALDAHKRRRSERAPARLMSSHQRKVSETLHRSVSDIFTQPTDEEEDQEKEMTVVMQQSGKTVQLPSSGKSVVVLKKKVEKNMRKYIEEALVDEVRSEMSLRMEQGLVERLRKEQAMLMRKELQKIREKEVEELEALFGTSTKQWEDNMNKANAQIESLRGEVEVRDSMVSQLENVIRCKDEELEEKRLSISEKEMLLKELLHLNRRYKGELESMEATQKQLCCDVQNVNNNMESDNYGESTPGTFGTQMVAHRFAAHGPRERPSTVANTWQGVFRAPTGTSQESVLGVSHYNTLSRPQTWSSNASSNVAYSRRLQSMKPLGRNAGNQVHLRTKLRNTFLNAPCAKPSPREQAPKHDSVQKHSKSKKAKKYRKVLVPLKSRSDKESPTFQGKAQNTPSKNIYFSDSAIEAMKTRGTL